MVDYRGFYNVGTCLLHVSNALLMVQWINTGGLKQKTLKTARLRRKTNLQKSDYPKARIKRYPNPFCMADAIYATS